MLSSRLNSQLKPSLITIFDEHTVQSSLAFQVACAYGFEIANKFQQIHILLTEHDCDRWFQSEIISKRSELKSKINVVDVFDETYREKPIDHCLQLTEEKCLILIESLPWLLLRTPEGDLCRLLHRWSQSHVVMAVIPINCIDEESSVLTNLLLLSYITFRVKTSVQSETIEGRLEQRSKTSVDTIKSFLRFSLDSQLNVTQLREERMSNRKSKTNPTVDNASKTDVTANLTFNLRLKDDELAAKNNLVLPYTKQHLQSSNENFTIHYSYDKEDDIDEDEDDDLTL